MERDNKEVHALHNVNSAAFLLQVKNRVGSWYERARGTTNLRPIDMKMVLLKSLGGVIRKRIEIYVDNNNSKHDEVVSQTWSYHRIMGTKNNEEQMKQCSGGVRRCFESKEEALSQAHVDDMGQIRGENLGHKI